MYFITPSDPKIILFGIYETQIYGFGEKNGKLCIYTKTIFDIGEWKEFYTIDINVVKCENCDIGIHVAGGIFHTEEYGQPKYGRVKNIWIAARENEFTRIFAIDIDTMEFISYQMLETPLPSATYLNLCCKCLSPIIQPYEADEDVDIVAFYIAPQRYQNNAGIFHITVGIRQSIRRYHILKSDTFTLRHPPLTGFSNILFNCGKEEVISVYARDEESGRLCKFSKESADARQLIELPHDDDINWIWHEISFCKEYFLTRRNEGDKSTLQIYFVWFESPLCLTKFDYCTVDSNFPSLESTNFYISWRFVDEEYVTKKAETTKIFFDYSQLYAIPSMVVFQTADGKSIVTISFRVLSLSESAYLSLARIPQPSRDITTITIYDLFFQQIWAYLTILQMLQPSHHHHLSSSTVATISIYDPQPSHHHLALRIITTISIYDHFFQQLRVYLTLIHHHHLLPSTIAKISIYDKFYQKLREFYDKEEEDGDEAQCNPWMSQNFIKTAMGLPQSFSLTVAPNLPMI